MAVTRLHLQIDRLVLRGVDAASRDEVVASLEKTLRSLLARPQCLAQLARHHGAGRIDGGALVLPAEPNDAALGADLGLTIARALLADRGNGGARTANSAHPVTPATQPAPAPDVSPGDRS